MLNQRTPWGHSVRPELWGAKILSVSGEPHPNPLRDGQMLHGFAATPHFPLYMQWFAVSRLTSFPM